MEQDLDSSIEDGEVVDNDEETDYTPLARPSTCTSEVVHDLDTEYTPLQRPSNYATISHENPFVPTRCDSESNDDEAQSSSTSDSDSDHKYRAKKSKLKLRVKPSAVPAENKRKKYDIWSRLQEDVLAETLNTCDVTQKDRSRDVESYDYPVRTHNDLQKRGMQQQLRSKVKRNWTDRNDSSLRLRKREFNEPTKGPSRIITNLAPIDDASDMEIVAKDIANKLCEEKEELVLKIILAVGIAKATDTFKQVQQIEADGGMMIFNQSRRRTPGGIYFFLIKNDHELTRDQFDAIFGDDRLKHKDIIKKRNRKKIDRLKKAERARERDASTLNSKLPELLSRGELHVENNKSNWTLEKAEAEDVTNPPPTPEAEVISGEEMENGVAGVTVNRIIDDDRSDELDTRTDMDII